MTDEDISKLSPESQARISQIKPTLKGQEDFLIKEFTVPSTTATPPPNKQQQEDVNQNGTGEEIKDDINVKEHYLGEDFNF